MKNRKKVNHSLFLRLQSFLRVLAREHFVALRMVARGFRAEIDLFARASQLGVALSDLRLIRVVVTATRHGVRHNFDFRAADLHFLELAVGGVETLPHLSVNCASFELGFIDRERRGLGQNQLRPDDCEQTKRHKQLHDVDEDMLMLQHGKNTRTKISNDQNLDLDDVFFSVVNI